MEDDESNIETIVKLINNKEESAKNKNFKIISKYIRDNAIRYNVSFYDTFYSLHIPPSIVIYQGKEKLIYRINELTLLLNPFSKGDYFLKNKGKDESYSIKNSRILLSQNFKYGIKYEIIFLY